MAIITIKPSAIPTQNWQVGDVWQDQDGRQFRISDWDWKNREIVLVELEPGERNHPDYIDGTLDTSEATPATLLDPSKLPEPAIEGVRPWNYTPKAWKHTPKI